MGYSYQQMMQQPNLPQRGVNNKVLCNNGVYDKTNGVEAPCSSAGGVKYQPVKLAKISQDAEDKFYEKLGIETQSGGFMSGRLDSKLKGRFLVAVVLVGGYFAYKKFKK